MFRKSSEVGIGAEIDVDIGAGGVATISIIL